MSRTLSLIFAALLAAALHCSDHELDSRSTVHAQDKATCTIAGVDLLYLKKYALVAADCDGRGRVYLVTGKTPSTDVTCLPDSFNPLDPKEQ